MQIVLRLLIRIPKLFKTFIILLRLLAIPRTELSTSSKCSSLESQRRNHKHLQPKPRIYFWSIKAAGSTSLQAYLGVAIPAGDLTSPHRSLLIAVRGRNIKSYHQVLLTLVSLSRPLCLIGVPLTSDHASSQGRPALTMCLFGCSASLH